MGRKTVLAIITARGGSKRVPRKNIRILAGKPLIAWTIEEAKKSKYIDRLILSSEDSEIIQVARDFGCEVPFVRPLELAEDNVSGVEAVIHAINSLQDRYDYVLSLQPTSPLRKTSDIDDCIKKTINKGANCCVSISISAQNPYNCFTVETNDKIRRFFKIKKPISHGSLPKTYFINGAIYFAKCNWLLKTKCFITEETAGFVIPGERSIDVDTEFDLHLSEFLLKRQRNLL